MINLIVTLLFSTIGLIHGFALPEEPTGWDQVGSLLVSRRSEGKTWEAARAVCQSEGGDLLVDHGSTELTKYLAESGNIWIGLKRKWPKEMNTGVWEWVSGERLSSSSASHWRSGAPFEKESQNHFDCVQMNAVETGKWENIFCSAKRAFVCQKDTSVEETAATTTPPPSRITTTTTKKSPEIKTTTAAAVAGAEKTAMAIATTTTTQAPTTTTQADTVEAGNIEEKERDPRCLQFATDKQCHIQMIIATTKEMISHGADMSQPIFAIIKGLLDKEG